MKVGQASGLAELHTSVQLAERTHVMTRKPRQRGQGGGTGKGNLTIGERMVGGVRHGKGDRLAVRVAAEAEAEEEEAEVKEEVMVADVEAVAEVVTVGGVVGVGVTEVGVVRVVGVVVVEVEAGRREPESWRQSYLSQLQPHLRQGGLPPMEYSPTRPRQRLLHVCTPCRQGCRRTWKGGCWPRLGQRW